MDDPPQTPEQGPETFDPRDKLREPEHDIPVSPSKPPRSRKPFPGILQAIGICLFALVFQLIGVFILMVIHLFTGNKSNYESILPIADLAILNILGFGLVIFFGWLITKRKFSEVYPLTPTSFSIYPPLFITGIGLGILLSELTNIIMYFIPLPESMLEIFKILSEGGLITLFLLIIVAPVTEEFMCRGLFLHGFLQRYTVKKAIIAQAIIFSLLHLNPPQIAAAFIWGILFGWLYLKTKSLIPCLIAHAFVNSQSAFVKLLNIDIPGFTTGIDEGVAFQPPWFNFLGLLIFALGMAWLMKTLNTNSTDEPVMTF